MENAKQFIYYATKAPSGHNSQPWWFKVGENSIEIHPDLESALPVVDPRNRELYVSLGCAAENLRMAAAAFGHTTDYDIRKSKKGITFIRISIKEFDTDSKKNQLELIEKRQTNRSIYNGEKVANNILDELKSIQKELDVNAYYFENGSPEFSVIKEYIKKGNEIQMNDPDFRNELLSWIRFNKSEVKHTNNGLTFKVMGSPPTPKFIGKRIVASFLTPDKLNKSDIKKIDSASHFIVLTTKTDSTLKWIRMGFYMESLLLKLTELGIPNAYLNPPCEIESLSKGLQKELAINGSIPQY